MNPDLNIYGVLTGIGIVLILATTDKILKGKLKAVDFLFMILSMLFFSRLLAAMLYHGLYDLSVADWLKVTEGSTPVIWGQLFGLGLATFFVSKIRGIKHLSITDALLLNYPIATSLVRLGNYFNQELYGEPANVFWAIYIKLENRVPEYVSHAYYHPTFAYEIILNILNWIFLLTLRRKYRLSTGLITGFFMINYGIIRFVVNRFRLDLAFFLNIEVHDIFTIALSALGVLILIYFVFSKKTQKNFALIVSKILNPFVVTIIPFLIVAYQSSLVSLEIKILILALTVVTFLFYLISTKWKISSHLTYLAFTTSAIYLLFKDPLLILIFSPLLVLMAWSCIKLKHHDLAQTIAGTILGISVIVGIWLLSNSSLPF